MPGALFTVVGPGGFDAAKGALRRLSGVDHLVVFAVRPEPPEQVDEADPAGNLDAGPAYYPTEGDYADYEEMQVRRFLDEQVREVCDALGIPFQVADLPVDGGFEAVLDTFVREFRRHQVAESAPTGCEFFLAHTDPLVTVAAVMGCMLEGIPVSMASDPWGQEVVTLPLLKMRYADRVTDAEIRTLETLVEEGSAVTVTELADTLNVTPPTLSDRLSRMDSKGLVLKTKGSDGREVRVEATAAGRVFLRYGGKGL